MPTKSIFCNSPWYELHIYWDGSLGFCCQESHKIYKSEEAARYNLKNMTIREWVDSEPMRAARQGMFGDQPNSFCSRCYYEESMSGTSRRHKCNQKSVIFTKTAFEESYQQSPGKHRFLASFESQGEYHDMPVDIHIDLGNYCNLACKMCNPQTSSTIAAQYVKWGISDARQYLGTDWTRDEEIWQRTLTELASIKSLKNVHFMGGETLITNRFEDFLDFMITCGRTNLNFSFVTNGTVWKPRVMEKLSRFQRVGIEVSVETMTLHNQYQRQGTDNTVIRENLSRFQKLCDGSRITLTVRPAVSALTVGYYHTFLDFCLQENIMIKGLICTNPRYLSAEILPQHIKNAYLQIYQDFWKANDFDNIDIGNDFNESDPNQIRKIIKIYTLQAINLLSTVTPPDSDQQLRHLVEWCQKWDRVYELDARQLYPEFMQILDQHGYRT